jgi:Tat protein secretion system quality control protein TatD with DNase activity
VYIIEKLAEILNISPQEAAELSIRNSDTFFGI